MSTTTSAPSALDALHAAINSHNPFDRPLFVKQQEVWEKGFPDVPSLNAHVSDAVFEAIERIRTGQRSSLGITITAEKGLGKSHLLSRIRHRLQSEGGALFVYMSEFSNLDRIKEEFLQNLATSLKRTGSQGVMQWQELAAALVSDAYKKDFPPKPLVDVVFPNKITELLAKGEKPVSLINKIAAKILQTRPEIDNPYLIQAILWTLSKPHAAFAVNWLAGKGIAQVYADEMGLPMSLSENQETDAFDNARQILNLIGEYQTLVICFDELDSVGHNELALPKAMVVASLAKDVSNSLKRGIVLTAMFPATFQGQIKTMPGAEAVMDRIAEKVIDLNHPNSDDVVALVSTWLGDYYNSKGLIPPHPVYPFDENKLRILGKEKPIVRNILKHCAQEFKVPGDSPPPPPPPPDSVEVAYKKELSDLEWSIEDYLEDKDTLANVLWLSFASLIDQTLEDVQVKDVQEVAAKSADKGYIDFRIVGKENRKTVKIGVAIIQQANGVGVSAALKRLIDYGKFDLTRGCLIRSKPINAGAAKAYDCLRTLLIDKQGEWVLLTSEHIKPLLALWFVYSRMEDYEVSEEEFHNFIQRERLIVDNPLIREILSKPSGKIPRNFTNQELPISIPTVLIKSDTDSVPELTITD